jgi:hypothetical protein
MTDNKEKLNSINGKYLFTSKQEWYGDAELDDLQIVSSNQLVNILAGFLVANEKDYKYSYNIYNLSELNENDRDAINFMVYQRHNQLSNDSLEKRIIFYEKMLKLKSEELKLLDDNTFNPEMYDVDAMDLEIDKLETIISMLKDQRNNPNSENAPPF